MDCCRYLGVPGCRVLSVIRGMAVEARPRKPDFLRAAGSVASCLEGFIGAIGGAGAQDVAERGEAHGDRRHAPADLNWGVSGADTGIVERVRVFHSASIPA